MERADLDHLYSAMYEELRHLASAARSDHPDASLTPTSIVNEAYVRMVRSLRIEPSSELHFKRMAGRVMRQVLVDAARARATLRRGKGWQKVDLETDEVMRPGAEASRSVEVLLLDEALDRLQSEHPRPAEVMINRYFGGLSVEETAEALKISVATVHRDWRVARAWLSRALTP